MKIMGTVCMYKSVMCCAATPFGGGQTYVSDEFQEIHIRIATYPAGGY